MSRKRLTALALADALQGTDGDDLLTGTAGEDTLFGGLGNDTLLGRGGMDWLEGGAGNDTLDGNSGADRMIGGAGDDLYVVDDAADVVVEASGEGTDTVRSSISFSLAGQFIEHLTLTGIAAINATGNSLSNTLTGNIAANRLVGGGGNDVLDGRGGADIMEGGTGNDTFHVDNAGDRVIELEGEGTDTIVTGLSSFSLAELGAVERLKATGNFYLFQGIGNALDNVLEGGLGGNALYGGGGADTLIGGGGRDSLYGEDGADTLIGGDNIDDLYGGAGADTLIGGAGQDLLDGGAGADTMIGGDDDDIFVVDDPGDVIIETSTGGSGDLVRVSIDFSMSGLYINHLEMIASAGDLNATGNNLGNRMSGNDGSNILLGMGRSDRLYGGGGNDLLDGGEGEDRLGGGAGTDIFHLDSAGDTIEDFEHDVDVIAISAAWLGGGLEANLEVGINGFFAAGAVATSTGHGQFLFMPGSLVQYRNRVDITPARLLYDDNGAEAGGETLVALLNYNAAVTASDLVIIA